MRLKRKILDQKRENPNNDLFSLQEMALEGVPLPLHFYQQEDVVELSQQLLGKWLLTHVDGQLTGGVIIETEAYHGPEDRASHAWKMRRTKRNEVMYQAGGVSYVFMCYGIHALFNVVTNKQDVPHAVLIRSISPIHGRDIMAKRRGKKQEDPSLTSGPGSLTQALAIQISDNGESLMGNRIWIEDRGLSILPHHILATPRIGIDYAGEDAKLPWRFLLRPQFFMNPSIRDRL